MTPRFTLLLRWSGLTCSDGRFKTTKCLMSLSSTCVRRGERPSGQTGVKVDTRSPSTGVGHAQLQSVYDSKSLSSRGEDVG